jgi:hypothetical protein
MFGGFTMLLEFYRSNSKVTTDTLEKLDSIFISNRRMIGIASMIIGLAHFLFPSVLFL